MQARDATIIATLASSALAISKELCVDLDAVLANSSRRGLQHLTDRNMANTVLILLSNPLNSSESAGEEQMVQSLFDAKWS
jgi:hypothetical protein